MRLPRLLRAASFRLATFYVALFVGSFGLLGAIAYAMTLDSMENVLRKRIETEHTLLQHEYSDGGIDQVLRVVRERQRGALAGGLDYGVFDPSGTRIIGAVPFVHLAPGWTEVADDPDGDERPGQPEILLLNLALLPNGDWLAIGDDLNPARDLAAAMLGRFGWVIGLAVTLAIGGGIVLSNAFLRRVDNINRTAEAIIAGDLRSRIPVGTAGDDMDRLATTLNRMLDQIAALMESLRHAGNDIAHDLRTPLSRLRQRLDAARHPTDTAEYRYAIDGAIAEADALLDTFGALLRIAQVEAGTVRAAFAPLNLVALVDDVCSTFAPVAEDSGRSLQWTSGPAAYVRGDRELLVQLLVNLIENGLRHTQTGTTVRVTLSADAERVQMNVADDGPGIPVHEHHNVLQRFHRLEAARTTPGNGLGLSLVTAIATAHEARLVLGDAHPGLRVTIFFAAAPQPAPASSQHTTAALASNAAT